MKPFKSSLTLVCLLTLGLFSFTAIAQESGDTTSAPAASETETTTAPAMDNQHVARAVFTSSVENREPVDTISTLSNDKNRIYFYTDLRGLGGQTVTHRWEYDGKTMGEIKFNVGGPRWRVWSSKTLLPQWTGEWRVEILDGAGNKISEASFNYTTAAPAN